MDRWAVLGEDWVMGTENLRPDLVIQKNNEILILDITVPFENGLEAFAEARRIKERKYCNLVAEMSCDGKMASVQAIVVGALSPWDPENDKIIKKICSCRYFKLMKKIIVSETIVH